MFLFLPIIKRNAGFALFLICAGIIFFGLHPTTVFAQPMSHETLERLMINEGMSEKDAKKAVNSTIFTRISEGISEGAIEAAKTKTKTWPNF